MKTATDWAGLVRQERPDDCSVVAVQNLFAWLRIGWGERATIERWVGYEPVRGGDYERAAFDLWSYARLEVWMPVLWRDEQTEEYVRGLLADGWTLFLTVDSRTAGMLHAVVLVDDAFTVLDGQEEAPVVYDWARLVERDALVTMAVRPRKKASA